MTALVCPKTRQPLRLVTIEEANAGREPLRGGRHGDPSHVLLRDDDRAAYPVIDGIPILLAPEMLVRDDADAFRDTSAAPYAEAYEEMGYYERAAGERDELEESIAMLQRIPRNATFARAEDGWIDAEFDGSGQLDCYEHLAPNISGVAMQVGGKGLHAVKFLLGGAAEAWLVTPMLAEARWAHALASRMNVGERLHTVVAVAEEMPFEDRSIDAIYAGGTMHHLVIDLAAPELRRVLRIGGRLAACEPWKAPLYAWGTRVFGKRERDVHCRPIDAGRLASLLGSFPGAAAVHHGALLRYPLIALGKLGLHLGEENVRRIIRVDDALTARWARLRRNGSSIAILATRDA